MTVYYMGKPVIREAKTNSKKATSQKKIGVFRSSTKGTIDKIVKMHNSGHSLDEISERVRLCKKSVLRYIRLAGIKRERAPRCTSAESRERAKIAIGMRQDGMSLLDIAEKMGMSVSAINQYLSSAGLTNPRGRCVSEEVKAKIVAFKKQGLTDNAISKMLNTSWNTVWKYGRGASI